MTRKKFGSVHFIEGGNGGTYPYCHSLFIDAEQPVLIDPSSDKEELLEIKKGHPDLTVIHSHYHEDHFFYYSLFKEHPLWTSAPDAPAFSSLDEMFKLMGIKDEEMDTMCRDLFTRQFGFYERTVDHEFSDGNTIELGDARITVIGLPGHTRGHCGFYIEPDDVFFLADMSLTPFGPWYAHSCSSIEDTLDSIEIARSIDARVYLTSHAQGIFYDIKEELVHYKNIIDIRENKIAESLNEPAALDDIVKLWLIFEEPGSLFQLYEFAERGMVLKHLERLIISGKIIKNEDKYIRVKS